MKYFLPSVGWGVIIASWPVRLRVFAPKSFTSPLYHHFSFLGSLFGRESIALPSENGRVYFRGAWSYYWPQCGHLARFLLFPSVPRCGDLRLYLSAKFPARVLNGLP